MSKNIPDDYILSLVCVTVVLIMSFKFTTLFSNDGLVAIPAAFGYLGFLVTFISAIRVLYPQVRNSGLFRLVMLFDVVTLAQIVKKSMIEIKGKGKKYRQNAMVYGTALFPLSIFWIAGIFFLGGTYVNTDNATSVYVPAMIEKISCAICSSHDGFLYDGHVYPFNWIWFLWLQ